MFCITKPQLDIETGALIGVEALARWLHPEQGLIFPDKFISLAEREGLIGALTDEVISIAAELEYELEVSGAGSGHFHQCFCR